MGKQIPVELGEKIPLNAQEKSGDGSKVIRVDLRNMDSGAIIQSDLPMGHVANGYYRNTTVLMPNIAHVLAQYKVFDSDGVTPNTTGDQLVTDVFALAQEGSGAGGFNAVDGDLIVEFDNDDSDIDVVIEEPDEIAVVVDDPDEIEVFFDEEGA